MKHYVPGNQKTFQKLKALQKFRGLFPEVSVMGVWILAFLGFFGITGQVSGQCPPGSATAPSNATSCSTASFSAGTSANWYSLSANPFRMKQVNKNAVLSNNVNQLEAYSSGGTSYVFVATTHGLYRSTSPNDTTFTVLDTARAANGVFHDGTNLYVATSDGIFKRGADGSGPVTNWTTANGLPTNTVNKVFVSGTAIYAATSAGLYKSISGGTFTQIAGIPAINIFDVYRKDSIVLAGTGSGLYYSLNQDSSWTLATSANLGNSSNSVLSVYIHTDKTLFAGTADGLSISYDKGSTWVNRNTSNGLSGNSVKDVVVFNNIIAVATNVGPSFGLIGIGKLSVNTQFVGFRNGLTSSNLSSILIRSGSSRNLMLGVSGGGIALTDFNTTPTLEATGTSTFSPAVNYANAQKRYFADFSSGLFTCLTHLVRIPDIAPTVMSSDSTSAPSTCDGSSFGRIGLKGMVPNQQYFLRYAIGGVPGDGIPASNSTITADSTGSFMILLIDSAGTYNVQITSLEVISGQTDTCWTSVSINLPAPTPPADPVLNTGGSTLAICSNGANILVDLNPSGGTWSASDILLAFSNAALSSAAPADTAAAKDIYMPGSTPGSSGSYWFIVRNSTTRCFSDTLKVDYTVAQAPVLSCAGTTDGTKRITVSGFDATKVPNYTVNVSGPGSVVGGSASFSGSTYSFQVSASGNYTVSAVDNASGCTSNILSSCPAIEPPAPNGGIVAVAKLQTTVCINGFGSGNYRKVTRPLCTSDGYNDDPTSDFPVGRIRAPKLGSSTGSVAGDELVEMRGWLEFDLSEIPKEAVVDRIDYRAKTDTQAMDSPAKTCDVEMISATGDVQFDVTQVGSDFYPRPPGFNDFGFEDLYETKYADFTISRGAIGSFTDLGTTAVFDVQNRIRFPDKKFQLGLHLSGKDFDAPVLQFHGMIFAKAEDHQLCVTYHLLDFGDLPENNQPNGYDTDLAGNRKGASHRIDPVNISGGSALFFPPFMSWGLYLGLTPPDAEVNGLFNSTSVGDDNDFSGDYDPFQLGISMGGRIAFDDEDLDPMGFTESAIPGVLVAGDTVHFTTLVTNFLPRDATVSLFIDWNADGFFDSNTERYIQTGFKVPFNPGVFFSGTQSSVNGSFGPTFENIIVPRTLRPGRIGVRVRLSTEGVLDAYGEAADGEVEDFFIETQGVDFGDLPDATTGVAKDDFYTIFASDGARHAVPTAPVVYLGSKIDFEADGVPSIDGFGDDNNVAQSDDEDGIVFLTPMSPGTPAKFSWYGVNSSMNPATLSVWVDWDNDGTLEPINVLSGDMTLLAGQTIPSNNRRVITFDVPLTAKQDAGRVHFRFRFTTAYAYGVSPSVQGLAVDGEVEDYMVPVHKIGNMVWEDRNHNGFQDAEEIGLGIKNVRVVLHHGGVHPNAGEFGKETFDAVRDSTHYDPNASASGDRSSNTLEDYVIDTLTADSGLYVFKGMIEGFYQVIAVDTFGLTPTRYDWIRNLTEEDRDSDGKPLKNAWEMDTTTVGLADKYLTGMRRQSRSQEWLLKTSTTGTGERGILDQRNPFLPDPNEHGDPFPDNRVEQRIDFGYVGLDFGDLPQRSEAVQDTLSPATGNFWTIENGFGPGTDKEGPKHIVTPDLRLGVCQDVEWGGQSDADAGAEFLPDPTLVLGGGDDPIALKPGGAYSFANYPTFPYDLSESRRWPYHLEGCGDDEDGVRFLTPMVAGSNAKISLRYLAKANFNGPDAYLHAWMDWNGDGDFEDGSGNEDADEHILFTELDGNPALAVQEPVTKALQLEMFYLTSTADSIILTFKVPSHTIYNNGGVLSRFRISYDPRLRSYGVIDRTLGATGALNPMPVNFPDTIPGAASTQIPGGIIPYGEVEDYFIALNKVGNVVWEDRNYNGIQDTFPGTNNPIEPGIAGVPVQVQYAGLDGILNNGDPFEAIYFDTTDALGRWSMAGLLAITEPLGSYSHVYRIVVSDPASMTATYNNPDPSDDNCNNHNSNGDDLLIDDRITADTLIITNPIMLCVDETGFYDLGDRVPGGNNLPPSLDADDRFPDRQYDETRDFGFLGFDYGDLPVAAVKAGSAYPTLRDSMDAAFSNKFGARHAIQPRLFLGSGVDAELNGQPDDDAGNTTGGDDDGTSSFVKGTNIDDENGVTLLSPLLPGERAYIKVKFTSRDTTNSPSFGYVNKQAFLDVFMDWNGDGVFNHANEEKIAFTHQLNGSASPFSTNATLPANAKLPNKTVTLPNTSATGVDSVILAFDVPNTATFDSGIVYMRFRLGWTDYAADYAADFANGLTSDNNIFHSATTPFVHAHPPFGVAQDRYPYPQGEVEDYGVQVAKISNLAWYDHDVFGDQDAGEDFVDSLQLVLVWGGVNAATGLPDTVGYQSPFMPLHASQGAVTDLLYNRTVLPPQTFTASGSGNTAGYPLGGVKLTGTSPAADSGRYSFRGLIPGFYYVIPEKYLKQDSASFVAFWPRHRVMTLQDNSGVSDVEDSDGIVNSDAAGQSSRGPGAFLRINDANGKTPEVTVNNRPLNENSTLVDGSDANPNTPVFFPDDQWDKTVDFGWIDEPNIEANLDIVGVNYPTSQTCYQNNVIMHLCVKNPTEVPLDSFMMSLNLKQAYGDAFVGNVRISLVDSAYAVYSGITKVRKSTAGVIAALTPFLNSAYNGDSNIQLFNSTGTGGQTWNDISGPGAFSLPGDGTICVRIEFEIDERKKATFLGNTPDGWHSQALVYARAVGLRKDNNQKRPVRDFRFFNPENPTQPNPRFGFPIQVRDWSDEFDDSASGDSILFEGFVTDRGINGDYQTFLPYSRFPVVSTGRDKYADENDFTIHNDSCWINTRWNGGVKHVNITLDVNCSALVDASVLLPNFISNCGFDKYPEGSYYRVIIVDKHTNRTIWSSAWRTPFDIKPYLGRQLTYEVKSVANFCHPIFGDLNFEDKTAPILTCPPTTDKKLGGVYTFTCTDVDSVLNVPRSYTDPGYAYYTGIATGMDNCTSAFFESATDRLTIFPACSKGDTAAVIERTFLLYDVAGNESRCTQLIYFRRPRIILPDCKIEVPAHLARTDSVLTPRDMVSKYGFVESVPYYLNGAGVKVHLTEREYCSFGVFYEDKYEYQTGLCGRKIIRTWSIMDWCYSSAIPYPDYLLPSATADSSCHAAPRNWLNKEYKWEQLLVVGDETAPVVKVFDVEKDGVSGTGYPGIGFNPYADNLAAGYDAGDYFEFSTGPIDCSASIKIDKSFFTVQDESPWCYEVEIWERKPVLDLDKLPTGEYTFAQYASLKVSGDCNSGYTFSGLQMPKDTSVTYFAKIRVTNICYRETNIFVPIRIVDKVAPVMKCTDQVNVSFDNVGVGSVSVNILDAGSVDACSKLAWRKLRRLVSNGDCRSKWLTVKDFVDVNKNGQVDKDDYIDENRNKTKDTLEAFSIHPTSGALMSPYLNTLPMFCCDGDSVMVELWGEDKVGNRNFCWNWIKLEDKTPLDFLLPFDKTYTCTQERPLFNLLSKAGTYAEGTPEYSASVTLFKEDISLLRGHLCSTIKKEIVVQPSLKCNGPSAITIRWRLTKLAAKGAVTYDTPTRTLTVLPVNEYNIMFPADVIGNCTDLRDTANVIDGGELGCDVLAVLVQDKRYNGATKDGVPVAECYKIFRTFTVINWCQYTETCLEPMKWAVVVPRDIAGRPGAGAFNGVNVLVRDPNAIDPASQPKYYFEDAAGTVPYPGARNVSKERANAGDKVAQSSEEVTSFAFNDSDPRGNPNCPTPNGLFAWMFTQYILVHDEDAPVVLNDRAPAKGWIGYQNKETCGGQIAIEFSTQDMCSATEIQAEGGNTIIERVFLNPGGDKTKRTGAAAVALNPTPPLLNGDSKTSSPKQVWVYSSKVLPLGKHSLTIVARDDCGNISRELDIPFTILDTNGTAPICINGLSTNLALNPQTGNLEAVVWATDFKAPSEVYDCSGQGANGTTFDGNKKQITSANYYIYMDVDGNGRFDAADGIDASTGRPLSAPYQSSIKITCAQLRPGSGSNPPAGISAVLVRVYTRDNAGQYAGNTDNWSWCETFVTVDNGSSCSPSNGSSSISGLISTETKVSVAGVEVNLSGRRAITYSTGANGEFSFSNLEKGYDYTVTPILDQNPVNGVTTMDLVMIAKHILGQVPLTSPYKLIAADVNNSKTITTMDLVQLRRLILGIDGKLQNNTSWRFVDNAFRFPDLTNPWKTVFPEVASINNLPDAVQADFVAVKIGDVNGSALGSGTVRTTGVFWLNAQDKLLKAGAEVRIPITAAITEMEGYQFTLDIDRNMAEVVDLEYGVMQAEHFGVFAKEGLISASWNAQSGYSAGETLFTLILRAKTDVGSLREVIRINSRITAAEGYSKVGNYQDVGLSLGNPVLPSGSAMLYQNIPNPFAGETVIGFHLVQAGEAILTVSDVQGRVVRVIRGDYGSGYHQVRLRSEELPAGVLQYTLTSGDFTATRRMVVGK